MVTLYVRPFCQYCERVLRFALENNLEIQTKDISDREVAAELVAEGGKRQVPYLVDEAAQKSMYESADIILYLKTHYVR